MHYAVYGQTAAELIVNRAMAEKEHMDWSWGECPWRKIVVRWCKHCKKLSERRRTGRYGTFGQCRVGYGWTGGKASYTHDDGRLGKRIDIILEAGGDNLSDAGKVTAELPKFAEPEFEKYRPHRLFSRFQLFNQKVTTCCHLKLTW